MEKFVIRLLAYLDLCISRDDILKKMLSHPLYPSLAALSDSFDQWGIRHTIAKLSLDQVEKLSGTIVTSYPKNKLACIKKVSSQYVFIKDYRFKNIKVDKKLFVDKWDGISLVIEDANPLMDKQCKRLDKFLSRCYLEGLISSIYVVFLLLGLLSSDFSASYCVLFVSNLVGFFISIMLFRSHKLQTNTQQLFFCKRGWYIDCNKVQYYSKLKIFQYLSEVSVAYFFTVLLILSLNDLSSVLPIIAFFLLMALPVVFLSFFLQFFIIKSVCLYCVIISLTLLFQCCYFYQIVFDIRNLPSFQHLKYLTIIIFFFLIIIEYTKLYRSKGMIYIKERQLNDIKYDLRTLTSQLSTTIYKTPDYAISFGSSLSKVEITIIVSLYCRYCGKAIMEISRLKDIYKKVKYKIIFDTVNESDKSILQFFASLKYFSEEDPNKFFSIIDRWYSLPTPTISEFSKFYNIDSFQVNYDYIDSQSLFLKSVSIGYLPSIMINGKLLSSKYKYTDLDLLSLYLSNSID